MSCLCRPTIEYPDHEKAQAIVVSIQLRSDNKVALEIEFVKLHVLLSAGVGRLQRPRSGYFNIRERGISQYPTLWDLSISACEWYRV